MKSIFAVPAALTVVLLLFSCGSNATDGATDDAKEELRAELQAAISESMPGVEITEVRDAPLENMVEVLLNDQDRVFMTRDGRFLLVGRMLELRPGGPVDHSEQRLEEVRRDGLAALDREQLVSFPADKERAEVFVFTDPTCGYCRRLHQEMSQINRRGITVHYLAYPRAGLESEGGDLMQAIWCAADGRKAMDDAKLRQQLSETPAPCENPVAEQYRLGSQFGVRGTPAIYDNEGRSLGGYLPPGRLAEALGL